MEIKIFGYDAAAVVGVLKVVEEKEKLLNEIMKLSRPEREKVKKLCRLMGGEGSEVLPDVSVVSEEGSSSSAQSPEKKPSPSVGPAKVVWKGTTIRRYTLEAVKRVVKDSGDRGVLVDFVADTLGCGKSTAYVALKYLENEEGVVECDRKRSGHVFRMVGEVEPSSLQRVQPSSNRPTETVESPSVESPSVVIPEWVKGRDRDYLQRIQENGGEVTIRYLMNLTGYSSWSIRDRLNALIDQGILTRRKDYSSRAYFYSMKGGEMSGVPADHPVVVRDEEEDPPVQKSEEGEDLTYRVMGYMNRPVTYNPRQVAKALGIPAGSLNEVLKGLSEAGIVRITSKKGYVIPSATLVGDLILGAVSTGGDPQTVEKICVNIGGYVAHWIVVEVIRELAAAGKVKINSRGLVYREG